jgi:hypothetical protein
MSSLAVQRLTSLLQTRKLDATLVPTLPSPVEGLPTGMDLIDARLGGGWPYGEVSELVGGRSSGRTSILMATLAAATRRGGLVGLVDAFDRFDPLSAARAGIDLDLVLWVRGPSLTLAGPGPRTAVDRAVLSAIRALDLIVRAGGFAIAALDLADAPARGVSALPMATWLRLAHANEGRETVCLLLGERSVGRSARGIALHLDAQARWSGTHAQSRRLAGLDIRAQRASATMGLASSDRTVAAR